MLIRIFLFSFLGFSLQVQAQMDPSSALLLRKGGRVPEKESLDTGRYTIRPGDSRPAETPKPAPAPPQPPKVAAPTPPVTPNVPASVEPAAPPPAAPVTEQVKELVLGGTPEEIDTYRDRLHPEDIRHNLVDLTLAPGFAYTEASSNYWFREYSSASAVVMVGAQIWITPFFGVSTSFVNSLGGAIYGTEGSANRISLDQQWLDAGFRWRKFFGISRKSALMTFGLDFSEYSTKVPANATKRVGTKTVGARISWEATLPRGTAFAWAFGGSITPRADHREEATALNLKSGASDETTTVALWMGGNHTFDRQSQLFWRVQHSVERNFFEGAASTADPVTGSIPNGVSVTTGITMFTFGYRWGN